MPPPNDGNEYLAFTELIKLDKVDEVTYQSVALPFSPGRQTRRVKYRSYGGHVYAQAAWAACQTVKEDLVLHNANGNFLLAGQIDIPFIYSVQKIRDGRSFCTRMVHVTQGESKDICFTGLFSFKVPETSWLDVQDQVDLWHQYKVVLEGKRPEDFPEVPGVDVPWYWKLREETGHNDEFPGLENTQVDMTEYNKDRHPLDRRTLLFYRAIGQLPPDPNLHRCAHLYASDRNSLFHVANHMDVGDVYTQMSTLIHMTIFHSTTKDLMFGPSESNQTPMDDTSEKGRWFAQEDWFTRTSLGRTQFEGRMWASDGTHVATMVQDGLLRYTKKPEATEQEVRTLQDRQKGWKPRGKI